MVQAFHLFCVSRLHASTCIIDTSKILFFDELYLVRRVRLSLQDNQAELLPPLSTILRHVRLWNDYFLRWSPAASFMTLPLVLRGAQRRLSLCVRFLFIVPRYVFAMKCPVLISVTPGTV